MPARARIEPRLPGFQLLHLVAAAGALLGLAEGIYHLLGPRPPAGVPGAEGPSLLAYAALGMTAFLLPALLGALLTARAAARPAAIVVWLAAVLPTSFAYLDHVVHRHQLPGFLVETGGIAHVVRVMGVALVLAGLATALGVVIAERWWRHLERSGHGLAAAATSLVLPVLGLVVLWLCLAPAPGRLVDKDGGGGSRPNVLLLTIDTLRQDALGAYGGAPTPHLDAWIDQGVRADGWSPAPWTRPAMASIFAGVGTDGNGAHGDYAVHTGVDWWPERLAQAGYVTQAFVCNPHLVRRFGFDRGFDGYEHSGELERLEPIALSVWAIWVTRQVVDRGQPKRGDRVVAKAIRWLEGASRLRAPWFLWVHLVDPHLPYNLRGPEGQLVASDRPPWMSALEGDLDGGRFVDLEGARAGTRVTTAAARDALHRLYLREVRFADAQAGRLLEAARRAASGRGLVWILASDHGEEFWEHGGFEHGHSLHAEVLRVPLAMGGPGLPAGRAVEGMRLQDIGPTLLGLLGLPAMEPSQGSGLTEADSTLALLTLGHDLSGRLRAVEPTTLADANGETSRCRPPAMLADGMLYGPAQTRLMDAGGVALIRDDVEGRFTRMDVCDDPREAHPTEDTTCSPEEQSVLQALDAWRGRNEGRGTAVEIDPELRRSLGALGYFD
jgi:arylsulfatase A-like enzyme